MHATPLIHLIFVGFVALFPPINPIGTAIMVEPLLYGLPFAERKSASLRISMYCLTICLGALLVGNGIFKLFGISLPVVQLAGGILICRMGWQLLTTNATKEKESSVPVDPSNIQQILFYPLAFPMTTGAGTISVILTLSAHTHSEDWATSLQNWTALVVAILMMMVMIYLSYAYTPIILKRLGRQGELIVNRLSAFLVFCVGIQIGFSGLKHLLNLQ